MNRDGIREFAARELGLVTSNYRFAESREEAIAAAEEVGLPCVVKPVMSSSGKGQTTAKTAEEVGAACDYAVANMRGDRPRVIVEEFIEFDSEITLLTVATKDGILFCPPVGHRQEAGDYRESWQPAAFRSEALQSARHQARKVVEALGGHGIFGVEFFVRGDQAIFSELQPAPARHRHGHADLAIPEPVRASPARRFSACRSRRSSSPARRPRRSSSPIEESERFSYRRPRRSARARRAAASRSTCASSPSRATLQEPPHGRRARARARMPRTRSRAPRLQPRASRFVIEELKEDRMPEADCLIALACLALAALRRPAIRSQTQPTRRSGCTAPSSKQLHQLDAFNLAIGAQARDLRRRLHLQARSPTPASSAPGRISTVDGALHLRQRPRATGRSSPAPTEALRCAIARTSPGRACRQCEIKQRPKGSFTVKQ